MRGCECVCVLSNNKKIIFPKYAYVKRFPIVLPDDCRCDTYDCVLDHSDKESVSPASKEDKLVWGGRRKGGILIAWSRLKLFPDLNSYFRNSVPMRFVPKTMWKWAELPFVARLGTCAGSVPSSSAPTKSHAHSAKSSSPPMSTDVRATCELPYHRGWLRKSNLCIHILIYPKATTTKTTTTKTTTTTTTTITTKTVRDVLHDYFLTKPLIFLHCRCQFPTIAPEPCPENQFRLDEEANAFVCISTWFLSEKDRFGLE